MQNIPKIKICGITNLNDAREALKLGADSLGFNFYGESKRGLTLVKAKEIIDALRKTQRESSREFLSVNRDIIITGVFVNEKQERLKAIVKDLDIDIIQLSGTEPVNYIEELDLNKNRVLKVVHIKGETDIEKVYFYKNTGVNILLDTYAGEGAYGGTGLSFNLDFLKDIDLSSIMIAGGIGPDNIANIMEIIKPYGFDLSSKIEDYPGKKDYAKMSRFFDNFRGVLYAIS